MNRDNVQADETHGFSVMSSHNDGPRLMLRPRNTKWVSFVVVCALAVPLVLALLRRHHTAPSSAASHSRSAMATRGGDELIPFRLGSIAGTVTDVDSRPVAGAHVCAVPSRTIAATTEGTCADADASGRYTVLGLPAGSYLVTAAKQGFVTGSANEGRPIGLADAASTGIDIVLQPGGAKVTGLVVDATGGPVPHAIVRGERVNPPRVAVDVETDDLGRFALWFPPGPMILAAHADGYAPTRWYGPAPGVDIRLVLTPGATVRGVVVSSVDGAPLPNMEVRAVSASAPQSPLFQSSTSGPDGTFAVRGIEPGLYALSATGDGWHGELAKPIRLGLGSTIEQVRIEAGPGTPITGRVLIARTQQPCEQGTVNLGPFEPDEPTTQRDQASTMGPGLPPGIGTRPGPTFLVNIAANGVAHFPAVTPGRYSVHIGCLHYLPREGPRSLDVGSTAMSDLTWTVAPGLSLTVLTVDDRGRPTPGVTVHLQPPRGFRLQGRTDDTGRYAFSGNLLAGTYEISAQPPFEAEHLRVELRDGDDPATATLKVPGSASIVTTVRERGGGPVDGLSVAAVAQSPPNPQAGAPVPTSPAMDSFVAMSLGEGRYSIAPLKPGRYEIRVDDGANAMVRASYDVAAGQALETTTELERGGQIRGHVVDDDGAPVPDVWVRAIAPDHGRLAFAQSTLAVGTRALTNQDGLFVLDRLSGGDTVYTVRAERPEGAAAVTEGVKAGDQNVVIALRADGTLTGTVVGDCGGADAPVVVHAKNSATGRASSQQLSAANQPFRLDIAPGPIELIASCSNGHGFARLATELAPKKELGGLRLVLQTFPANAQTPP
jgi:hypothetical protein